MSATIGFIACDVYEEITRLIWQGVVEAASKYEVGLVFFAGGALNDPIGYRGQGNILYELINPCRVDGLIIFSSSIGFASTRGEMEAFLQRYKDLPVVSLEEPFDGIISLLKDEYGGLRDAISHLVETHGRRRIVFMQGPPGALGSLERSRAYQATLEAYGIPYDPHLVTDPPVSWTYLEGRENFIRFLDENALRPRLDFDAVVGVNDENAMAAINVLQERGIRVPDDISVTGFDDLAMAGANALPLTTVRPPFHQIGYQAVALLLQKLSGKLKEPIQTVSNQLIVRHSCGCLLPSISEAGGAPVSDTDLTRSDGTAKLIAKNESLAATISSRRKEIADEMAMAFKTTVNENAAKVRLARQILNGFVNEMDRGLNGVFLSSLDEALNQEAAHGGRVKDFQSSLSVLSNWLMPALKDEKLAVANKLLHQARVMVGETSWRHQAWKRHQSEDHARQLRSLGARLASTLDIGELFQAIAETLPTFGIRAGYLALYTDPEQPQTQSRLALGFDESGRLVISDDISLFTSSELIPEYYWQQSNYRHFLVEPLYIRNESLGFMVFETGGMEVGRIGEVLDALQMLISSSLKAALLHQEAEASRREAEAGWKLAEERQRAAEEASLLKSRFLSMVSHELRTPLNVISGLSENLLQEASSAPKHQGLEPKVSLEAPAYHRDLERIQASAQHLDSLIRDVLDLAVSHVGQLKLTLEKLDLNQVLRPVMEMGERMALEKGIHWLVDLPETLPLVIHDRTRLRQVVINLISNAVKFTERGVIQIRVEALTDKVIVSIKDTGLGIALEEQGLIFEEFHRTEKVSLRGYGGMGLGLAICRRLVEMGGGTIGVESTGIDGEGSRFYFSLPAVKDEIGNLPLHRTQVVMLLTERPERTTGLAKYLESSGYEVETSLLHEGDGWLQSVFDSPPGAIILDLNPAQSTGWEIARSLKNHPSTQETPVMFCTLFDEDGRGAMFALDYLEKPMNGAQLGRALVQHGLGKGGGTHTILIADDEENILVLHTRLVESQLPGSRVLLANNGKEALEVLERELPDLVLLDLMMPEVNGFQVLDAMREREATRCIPVIVLTSKKLSELEMQQLNQGVTAVLEKGLFSTEETLAQLEAALSKNKRLGSEARRIARRTMAYIHEHYKEDLARKSLASHAGVSQEYLSTCFHKETGIAPSTYIERYRIKQAKRLLESSDMPITQVGLEVGFQDSSYFARVFRREVGVTPNLYRKKTTG